MLNMSGPKNRNTLATDVVDVELLMKCLMFTNQKAEETEESETYLDLHSLIIGLLINLSSNDNTFASSICDYKAAAVMNSRKKTPKKSGLELLSMLFLKPAEQSRMVSRAFVAILLGHLAKDAGRRAVIDELVGSFDDVLALIEEYLSYHDALRGSNTNDETKQSIMNLLETLKAY